LTEVPDDAELERLGLYDPAAADADDRLRVLRTVFGLGAAADEVVEAAGTARLGDLTLDLAMRPPGPTLDLDEFAESSGFDPDLIRKMWQALGLPATGPVRVTADAAEAMRVLATMATLFTRDSAFAMARVIGSSSARMAAAIVGAFRVDIQVPKRGTGAGHSTVIDDSVSAGRDLVPVFLSAANAVFRRHLVLASYQLWSTDEEAAAVTHELSVGFADLVGSTEALRAGSVASMARAVREFEELVWDLVTAAEGRVVKLIGDEAMFVVEDPVRACAVGLDLVDASPHPIRVGLAHGTVAALYGDFYGETVNLAARLVDTAAPSTVTVSESVEQLARRSFTFDALAPQPLKGFPEEVPSFRLGRAR
jgi:class 3 adenylate cyclase